MSVRNATREGLRMAKFVLVAAVTAALLAGVNSLASPKGQSGEVVRQAGSIQVIEGPQRTIGADADEENYGGYDEVQMACPDGMVAIAGGFKTDNGAVWLNGSSPGSSRATWHLEVWLYSDEDAHWTPYVTCA